MLQAGVKGPSGTQAADRPFFQWMDLEPNIAVWFQRFGTRGVAHKENGSKKTCNFDKPLNNILEVMDGCLHRFYLVSNESHMITMIELQLNQFYTDLLYKAVN